MRDILFETLRVIYFAIYSAECRLHTANVLTLDRRGLSAAIVAVGTSRLRASVIFGVALMEDIKICDLYIDCLIE